MKTILISGAALTLGAVALATAPAFAATPSPSASASTAPGSGGVISITSAKDVSAPIYGGSNVTMSGTCPDDAVTLNSITSQFFAGGQATIGKDDPQAFTGSATVLPDIPAGSHGVTVSCTNQSGRTESFTGSFTVTPTSTPTTPVAPVTPTHPTTPTTPVTPTHPTTPTTPTTPVTPAHPSTSGTTPAHTIPSGAPDTGAAAGTGANDSVWPIALASAGVVAGAGMIWWGTRRQARGK
ncbi:hypothetical protein [Streptacidiphilus melanogenes]|uniref:hypothetical protein n=1 Tax=Streptacidiphilus melanogenes TaxID=411235 RepID=UPI0005A754D9|nr:hypothetical protein [Streptacidiphilus melanogenes]